MSAADLKPALVAGLRELGLSLSPAQVDQLLAYQDLIAKWNKVYNLTAVRDPAQMLSHHLVDSLSAIPPLLRHRHARSLFHHFLGRINSRKNASLGISLQFGLPAP